MSTSMATTPISGERVLSLPFMASFAYVASPISRLVCLEVVEALRPALRQRSNVTVMRIKAVVDMAVKAAMAVKPRACSNKYSANKPIRPVVAVRSTVIWGIVEDIRKDTREPVRCLRQRQPELAPQVQSIKGQLRELRKQAH